LQLHWLHRNYLPHRVIYSESIVFHSNLCLYRPRPHEGLGTTKTAGNSFQMFSSADPSVIFQIKFDSFKIWQNAFVYPSAYPFHVVIVPLETGICTRGKLEDPRVLDAPGCIQLSTNVSYAACTHTISRQFQPNNSRNIVRPTRINRDIRKSAMAQ